jgi:3-oxoacyl-[acyl-carrier-protein] synthase II
MSACPVARRRVVVTGLGIACALGLDPPTYWQRLLAGECGIRYRKPTAFSHQFPVKIAGVIADDELAAAARGDDLREPDRNGLLALYVAGRALADAGLATDGAHPRDMDVIVGSGHGTMGVSNQTSAALHQGGYRKVRPTAVLRAMFNRPANLVSIRYRLTGDSHVVCGACASASIAFGEAFHRICFGLVDQVLAASADTGLDDVTYAAWNRLGVLSKIPDPERASRPFDRGRDGLVIGEGAAAFVLESLDSARARGARAYAEVLGYGVTSDSEHLVHPQSEGQVRAVRRALAAAELSPADIDFISAHGVATILADPVEAASLREAFGAHAERVPISTTKGQLGHLMGATAGIELLTTILVLQHGLIPPCRNLDDPDPRCSLSFVRDNPLKAPVTTALKNCFAFGGTNSVVILRRWDDAISRR